MPYSAKEFCEKMTLRRRRITFFAWLFLLCLWSVAEFLPGAHSPRSGREIEFWAFVMVPFFFLWQIGIFIPAKRWREFLLYLIPAGLLYLGGDIYVELKDYAKIMGIQISVPLAWAVSIIFKIVIVAIFLSLGWRLYIRADIKNLFSKKQKTAL